MPSRPNIDSLRLQIGHVRVSNINKQYFVPESSLQLIFTATAIAQAVPELECQPEDRIGLGDAIQRQGVTTFAILVWMGREDSIVEFRRRDCLDSNRLSHEIAMAIAPCFGSQFTDEYSWQFRPHFFHMGEHVEIDERKILPFLCNVGNPEEGGHGLVTKVEVHPQLQDFCPGSVRCLESYTHAEHPNSI